MNYTYCIDFSTDPMPMLSWCLQHLGSDSDHSWTYDPNALEFHFATDQLYTLFLLRWQ